MTLFRDMPEASLKGWLLWCANHDWGGDHPAWFDDMTGELVTYGQVAADDEGGFRTWIEEARHRTPKELKAWAGY